MSITIKVEHGAAAKAYRFNTDQTLHEVIKSVKEKTNFADDIKELGVYQPADGMRPGRWLRLDKTLAYYDVKNNDMVVLKKRARPLKLRMIDGTTKTVMVDDSITMVEIVDIVGEKLNISNPEEYSLAKLDGTWLLPTQSLGEQGVDEKDVLMLKKKFFVTDANIDRSDPMQMHMLYVQCRDNVISGRMPCSYDEAVKLAAMTLQCEYGNIQPNKYEKKGCLKEIVKNIVAPQHLKQYVKAEKDILDEWKKLTGTAESNAKFRYLNMCRGLKTYGITCYMVQERVARGKKMQEIMIGITKDHIYRMDPETKEVTKSNKITELRRWAASPKSFTFDFGDYEGDYYTVMTLEGESMSQLISGYIDILLKRRKDMGKIEEQDDSSMAAEELVAPIRSAAITTTWSGIGYDPNAEQRGQEGNLSPGLQRPGIGGVQGQTIGGRMGQAQKAGIGPNAQYITDIDACEDAINQLLEELDEDSPWMRMKSELTPDQWRQKLNEAMMATGKSMEEVMRNAQKGNKTALNGQAKAIFQNVQDLIRAAQMAGLGGEDDISLLEGARLMSEAVKNLLACAKDLANDPNDPGAQARLAEAARVLQAAQLHMAQAMKGNLLSDPISEELILASGKAVSSAANQLKDLANEAAAKVPNPNQRDALLAAAENEAQAASFVYLTHKMLAGVINAPGAKAIAEETAKGLQSRLGELMKYAKLGLTDSSLLDRIAKATKDVNDAVAQLMLANDCAATMDLADIPYHAKKIADNVEVIEASQGQKAEIVKAINEVARSGVWLSSNAPQTAKLLADPAQQQRLLASAKALSEHTNAAVAAGKLAVSDPNDNDAYRKLLEATKRVRDAATQLVGESGKAVQFRALQTAAKQVAAATTDLVYSSKGSLGKLKPGAAHQAQLEDSANRANGAIERLLQAVKRAHQNPDSLAAQNELLTAATAAAIPAAELTATAKETVPEVDDLLAKRELNDDATAASKALQDLMLANQRAADALGAREMEHAIQEADAAASAMDALILNAEVGGMAEPHGNLDQAVKGLAAAAQQVTGATQGVRDAAVAKPDNMGAASRQVGPAVGALASAAKAVAQAAGEKSVQVAVLSNAKMAAVRVKDQVTAARAKLYSPSDKQASDELEAAQQALKDALAGLVSAASGADVAAKECDEAINAINNDMENVDATAPAPGYEWGRAGEDLENKSKALGVALNQVALAAKQNPKNLGMNAKLAQIAFRDEVQAVNAAIGATQSPAAKTALAGNAENVGKAATRLLTAAKLARQDPGRVDKAVADVTAALQALAAAADQATPGHDELVAAMEAIKEALARLGQADPERDQPANRKLLNDSATALGETVGQMSVAARNQTEKLGPQAQEAAAALRGVLLAAGGLSPDVLDLTNAVDRIQEQFAQLNSAATVIPAAKEIAKASSAVVNQARYYITSNPDTDPALKRELISGAQALATLTSQLAAEAKNWQANPDEGDAGIKSLQKDMAARLNAVRAINHKLSSKARSSPLLMSAARALAEASTNLIKTLKTVAARPKDAAAQSAMSASIGQVTEGIKRVLDASTSLVPGQRECDEAIAKLSVAASELASAAMQAAVGVFMHQLPRGKTAQEVQEEVVDLAKELLQSTNGVIEAAFKNQTAIGPTVAAIARAVSQLVEATKNSAATSTDATVQQTRLNGSKALADATLALVKAVKSYTANANPAVQAQLIEHARACTHCIGAIIQSMKPNVLGLRQCDEAIAAIEAAERLLDRSATPGGQSYQEVRNRLGAVAKELIVGISSLLKDAQLGNFDLVGADSKATADNIAQLNEVTVLLAATAPEAGVKPKLIGGGKAVTRATATMARNAKALTEDNKNPAKIAQLSNSFNQTTEAIRLLMAGIREGARGERDCEAALDEIKKLNGDLEAAALFAGTGQLAANLDAGKTLEDYHNLLTRSATDLRREAAQITQASQSSVEEVGAAAKALAKSLAGLAKGAKGSAALLADEGSQRAILSGAKAAGTATQEIVQASKELQTTPAADSAERQASGKEALDAAVAQLVDAANLASSQIVASLRELDGGKAGIMAAVSAIDHSPGATGAKADDIGVAARKIVAANQEALAALQANNWEVIGPAAAAQAEAAAEMLNATKGVVHDSRTNKKVGAEAMEAAKAAALAEAKFMDAVKFHRDGPESQERIRVANDEIMAKLQSFITVARGLPDGADLDLNEDQLAKLAEQELLNAAKQIEAAAARIMTVQTHNVDDQLPEALKQAEVTEAILEAARAITRAAAGLVQAATVSQKELAAKGRADRSANPYKKDPAWAQGLISAAREVAGTVDLLVNSANDAAQKKAGEEHLVAATRQVAAAVARLQAASKAKADPSSPSQQKLELAAKSVASATSKVVDAAKAFTYVEEEIKNKEKREDLSEAAQKRREYESKAEIDRIEQSLQKARQALLQGRKDAYADARGEARRPGVKR